MRVSYKVVNTLQTSAIDRAVHRKDNGEGDYPYVIGCLFVSYFTLSGYLKKRRLKAFNNWR